MSVERFISSASKRISKKNRDKEIDIEGDFCKYAKRKGCNALKLIFLNRRGFPDRTILCPGSRVFFIEFKKDKNSKQSPIQKTVEKMLRSFGFEYYVCYEKGQAESILDEFLEW